MKMSIITVVYNNSRTLESAIRSVTTQTYKDIEYIIIDGGSTDGTLDIIKQYEDRLNYWCSEKDHGLYDAMNKGLQKATGEIIGILNSDDLYQDNDVISTVIDQFSKDKSLELLYGDLVYVNEYDVNKVRRKWTSEEYNDSYFERGNVPPHPALFVKAHVYTIAGLFNTEYRLAADYEFMLRVFKKHNFKSKYVKRLMVRMRLGGETNKSLKNIIRGNKEILASWRANGLKAPLRLMPLRFFKKLIQFI